MATLFSAFVLTRTISEDSFAKYPVSDPSQRLSSRGQSLRDPSPPGGSLQRTRLVPPKILVPRSWYQDLGTKIYGEPERRSLSVCRGARGAAGPPPGGLGGWKPPSNAGGLGGGSPPGSAGGPPPSKNNFMDKVKPITTPPDKVFKLSG